MPKEWNIRDAFIKDAQGHRVVDFRANNLHVVSYSSPVHATMRLGELQPHLHSLPEQPELIPYRTSYYDEGWGFCLSHLQRERLPDGDYEVCIDSTLNDGSLSYGECLLPGASDDEVLIYTHTCHPSLANDNLSGIAVCTFLARLLEPLDTALLRTGSCSVPARSGRWSGSVATRIACRGYDMAWSPCCWATRDICDTSGAGTAMPKSTVSLQHALKQSAAKVRGRAFSPYGYDERQFGSPGINLPVGRLSRSANGGYPEYHTSADNLALVRPDCAGQLAVGVRGHRRDSRKQRALRQHQPVRRASAWPPRLVQKDRRRAAAGSRNGDALDVEPLRWRPLAARHRRACRARFPSRPAKPPTS